MEEARFLLVTVHYGTVLGWMLCSGPYTGTSSVPYRQLPTTVTMNTESSPVSTYSNLVYSISAYSTNFYFVKGVLTLPLLIHLSPVLSIRLALFPCVHTVAL